MNEYLVTYTIQQTLRVEAENEEAARTAVEREDMTVNVIATARVETDRKRWTLAAVRRVNEAGGWYFFSDLRQRGETMRDFRVVHSAGRVFVERRRDTRRWLFNPETGSLDYAPGV